MPEFYRPGEYAVDVIARLERQLQQRDQELANLRERVSQAERELRYRDEHYVPKSVVRG